MKIFFLLEICLVQIFCIWSFLFFLYRFFHSLLRLFLGNLCVFVVVVVAIVNVIFFFSLLNLFPSYCWSVRYLFGDIYFFNLLFYRTIKSNTSTIFSCVFMCECVCVCVCLTHRYLVNICHVMTDNHVITE